MKFEIDTEGNEQKNIANIAFILGKMIENNRDKVCKLKDISEYRGNQTMSTRILMRDAQDLLERAKMSASISNIYA